MDDRVDGNRSQARWWSAGVFVAALAATFVLYHQLWADPFGSTLGRNHHSNDPMQTIWNLHWVPYALAHGHNPFSTDLIYFPHGASLSWNTLTPTLALAVAPITLTLGPVFAYTVLMTLAPAATATTAFWWLRRHVRHRAAAVAGAALIAFAPFVTGHLQGHLDLTFIALLPLILLLLEDLAWRHPRSQRSTAILLGITTAAQAGINEELLLIMAVAALLLLGYAVLARIPGTVRAVRETAAPLAAAFGVFVLAASPLLIDQLFIAPAVNLHSGYWRAAPSEYLWPLRGQLFGFGMRPGGWLGGAEDGVYLGPLLLAVLLVGIAATVRRNAWVQAAAFALFGCVLLTFGAAHPWGIPLPGNAVQHVPFLTSVLPARFSFASTLIIAWLLARWLDALLREGTRNRWLATAGIAAIVVALVSVVPRPIPASPLPKPPRFFTAARDLLPSGAPVLLLPSPTYSDASGMYWQQAAHFRFRMPGGYALRPDGSKQGAAYGPPDSPVITLASMTGQPRRPQLEAGRRQLLAERYRAIVVVDGLPATSSMMRLAGALTGRAPDFRGDGVAVWYLSGTALEGVR